MKPLLDSQNSFSCGSVAVGEILGFSCLCPSHCQVPSASSQDVSLLDQLHLGQIKHGAMLSWKLSRGSRARTEPFPVVALGAA